MYYGIVNLGHGVDACPKVKVAFTSVFAFRTGGDKVVGVNLLYGTSGGLNPSGKAIFAFIAKGAWFVCHLPSHYSRRFGVGFACHRVGTPDNEFGMVESHLLCLVVEYEILDMVDILHVSVKVGVGGLSVACPLEVAAIAAAPFPSVGEVDYGFHTTAFEFGYEIVESLQQCVVVDTRFGLENRCDMVA